MLWTQGSLNHQNLSFEGLGFINVQNNDVDACTLYILALQLNTIDAIDF